MIGRKGEEDPSEILTVRQRSEQGGHSRYNYGSGEDGHSGYSQGREVSIQNNDEHEGSMHTDYQDRDKTIEGSEAGYQRTDTGERERVKRYPEEERGYQGSSEDGDAGSSGGGGVVSHLKTRTYRLVIIEPVMTIYLAMMSAMQPLTSQYSMAVFNDRFNVSGTNSSSACGQVDTNSSFYTRRQEAQSAGATYQTILDLTQGIPTLIVAMLLGSYTDRVGRKVGLILPTVSVIIRCLIFMLPQLTTAPLEVTYLGSLLDGLAGSDSIMVSTCYAYLSDVTTVERRAFRILMAELVQNAVKGVIHLTIGYSIALLGFLVPYIILATFHVINLIYIVFFVPETRQRLPNQRIISKQFVIEPIMVVLGQRSGQRGLLMLGLAAFFCLAFGQQPQFSVENLFLLNSPLCWGPILISYWKFARIVIQCVTYVVVMKFMLQSLGDALVIILSAVSSVAYLLFFPFSTQTWMAFTALVIGFGAKQNIPVAKVMLSKLVGHNDQGGIMALTNVMDKFCSIIGNAVFNPLYGATLLFFKGTVYVCFAVITTIGTILIGLFIVEKRAAKQRNQQASREISQL